MQHIPATLEPCISNRREFRAHPRPDVAAEPPVIVQSIAQHIGNNSISMFQGIFFNMHAQLAFSVVWTRCCMSDIFVSASGGYPEFCVVCRTSRTRSCVTQTKLSPAKQNVVRFQQSCEEEDPQRATAALIGETWIPGASQRLQGTSERLPPQR